VCVGVPMVIVEDEDGGDDGRGDHEHDTVEVCTCRVIDRC
jgi:hypothetical protein